MDSKVASCLNILRRTPPCDTDQNLKGLVQLLESNDKNDSLIQALLQRVDPPLKILHDEHFKNKPFLICDHNREDTSYRSPWTNQYYPVEKDHMLKPNNDLRTLEQQANEVLEVYMDLYYGKGESEDDVVSSAYLWDTNKSKVSSESPRSSLQNGFAAIFLLCKRLPQTGFWNSIHVMEVSPISSTSKCTYKLTTTLLISIDPLSSSQISTQKNDTQISASTNRQLEKSFTVDKRNPNHLEHMGKLLEENEQFLRVKMDSLYLSKTYEIVQNIRPGGLDCDYESSTSNIDSISNPSSTNVPASKAKGEKVLNAVSVRGGNAMHASLLSQAILKRAAKNDE